MKKNDLLLEKYLGEKGAVGVMDFHISQFEKMKPGKADLRLGVKLAMNTLRGAIEGIRSNLKDFDAKFQKKVIMEALKKLGV